MHRFLVIATLSLVLLTCDQVPNALYPDAVKPLSDSEDFDLRLAELSFDYLDNQLFISLALAGESEGVTVSGEFFRFSGVSPIQISFNDSGFLGDIQSGDGVFDRNLAINYDAVHDTVWTFLFTAFNSISGTEISLPYDYSLSPPLAPVIQSVSFTDTLQLLSDALVIDTLRARVSHEEGVDEIRDVTMMSLKPDGEYANNGQPIPLYDDGGQTVFFTFQGVDFTSGDDVAGDGQYALLLVLDPTTLAGVYHWTFSSRTWLGTAAEDYTDSLLVLPVTRGLNSLSMDGSFQGVFK
jgi:DUF971 family protein